MLRVSDSFQKGLFALFGENQFHHLRFVDGARLTVSMDIFGAAPSCNDCAWLRSVLQQLEVPLEGIKNNGSLSQEFLLEALENVDDLRAFYVMGKAFASLRPAKENEAFAMFKRSEAYPLSLAELGAFYHHARGPVIEMDPVKAKSCFLSAIAEGDVPLAYYKMGEYHSWGTDEIDETAAMKYYRAAVDRDYWEGCEMLAKGLDTKTAYAEIVSLYGRQMEYGKLHPNWVPCLQSSMKAFSRNSPETADEVYVLGLYSHKYVHPHKIFEPKKYRKVLPLSQRAAQFYLLVEQKSREAIEVFLMCLLRPPTQLPKDIRQLTAKELWRTEGRSWAISVYTEPEIEY
jgi:hypothetical protein